MKSLMLAVVVAAAAIPARADIAEAYSHLRRGEPDLAYAEFRKAAEAGDIEAARALGLLLHRGMDVRGGGKIAANPAEAAKWFRVGAEGGDKVSAELLGIALCGGRGGEARPAESMEWFRKAGLDLTKALASLEKYPAEDRPGLACWQVAFESARKSEARSFDRRRLPKSAVTVLVDAATGQATIEPPAQEHAEGLKAFFDRLLVFAPPSAEAVRHKLQLQYRFTFE